MKNGVKLLSLVLLLSALACNKEEHAAPLSPGGKALSVSIKDGDISKLFLTAPSTLKWASSERVIAFNEKGEKFISEERGGTGVLTNAQFVFNDWTGEPAFFMFNQTSNTESYDGAAYENGNIIAMVSPVQKPTDKGTAICRWAPVTVGVAEKTEGEGGEDVYVSQLNNVTGYISFTIAFNENIQSVEISSLENVDIAGKVKISAESIELGAPQTVVVDGSKSITVMPTAGAATQVDDVNCFNLSTYYVGVLPGSFTPVLTFTDSKGRKCVKKSTVSIDVNRAECYNLKTIDADLKFEPIPTLPDKLTFTLGTVWNFKESAPVEGKYENQKAGNKASSYYGETYNYNYVDAQSGFSASYPFIFCKHYSTEDTEHGYYYDATKGFVFIKSGACMTLPAIPNYSLVRVEMTCNKNSKLDNVFGYPHEGETLNTFTGGEESCYDLVNPGVGQSYYLYFYTSSNITISNLKLIYQKQAMPQKLVIGYDYEIDANPYTNVFTGIPTVSTKAADTPFTQNSYTFTPKTGSQWYWNGNNFGLFCINSGDYLKLPTIAGYKLNKVKFGSRQTSNKIVKIVYTTDPDTAPESFTEVASCTINHSKEELVIGDPYNAAKVYYYQTGTGSIGLCSFELTYKLLN